MFSEKVILKKGYYYKFSMSSFFSKVNYSLLLSVYLGLELNMLKIILEGFIVKSKFSLRVLTQKEKLSIRVHEE